MIDDQALVWAPSRTGGRLHAIKPGTKKTPLCGQKLNDYIDDQWGKPECRKCTRILEGPKPKKETIGIGLLYYNKKDGTFSGPFVGDPWPKT